MVMCVRMAFQSIRTHSHFNRQLELDELTEINCFGVVKQRFLLGIVQVKSDIPFLFTHHYRTILSYAMWCDGIDILQMSLKLLVRVKSNEIVQAGFLMRASNRLNQVIKMTPIGRVIEERGLLKSWVARKAGIAPGTLSKIISGESEPTLKVALRLARVLNITVEELWGHLISGEKEMKEGVEN